MRLQFLTATEAEVKDCQKFQPQSIDIPIFRTTTVIEFYARFTV